MNKILNIKKDEISEIIERKNKVDFKAYINQLRKK